MFKLSSVRKIKEIVGIIDRKRQRYIEKKRRVVRNTQVGDDYPSPEPLYQTLLGLRRKKKSQVLSSPPSSASSTSSTCFLLYF